MYLCVCLDRLYFICLLNVIFFCFSVLAFYFIFLLYSETPIKRTPLGPSQVSA